MKTDSPFEANAKPTLRRMAQAGVSLAGVGMAASAVAPGMACANQSLLHQGSQGDSVKKVQAALGEKPSGYFDGHTRADVVSFQQNHGLQPDGIVGPKTRGVLFASGGDPPLGAHAGAKHFSTGGASTTHANYRAGSKHSSSSGSAQGSSGGSAVPNYIVQCESRGNYHAVNRSTGAGGAYQIMPSTWRAYGGTGSPQNASKQQQDQIASKIYKSQGSSPWSCAK